MLSSVETYSGLTKSDKATKRRQAVTWNRFTWCQHLRESFFEPWDNVLVLLIHYIKPGEAYIRASFPHLKLNPNVWKQSRILRIRLCGMTNTQSSLCFLKRKVNQLLSATHLFQYPMKTITETLNLASEKAKKLPALRNWAGVRQCETSDYATAAWAGCAASDEPRHARRLITGRAAPRIAQQQVGLPAVTLNKL